MTIFVFLKNLYALLDYVGEPVILDFPAYFKMVHDDDKENDDVLHALH